MVTDQVSASMRTKLLEVGQIREVNIFDSGDAANLAVLARPELGITFTKLHCWTLTDFTKCVFLDADTLVVQNCDDLFEREELSAAPDVGWPDCFNSGVFVFKPSMETYSSLIDFAVTRGSFDGGDQGLLNSYFSDWATKDISRHLPFVYNMTATAVYSYRPAYNQFGTGVRIVHFTGATKPWQVSDGSSFQTFAPSEHVSLWWKLFQSHVRPKLTLDMKELSLPIVHDDQEDHGSDSTVGVALVSSNTQPLWQSEEEVEDVKEPQERLVEEEMKLQTTVESVTVDEPLPPPSMTLTTLVEVLPSGYDWLASEVEEEDVHHTQPAREEAPTVSTGAAAQIVEMDLATEAAVEAVAGGLSSEEQIRRRREAWERGEIDYKGEDSFDNIMQKMKETMSRSSPPPKP